MKFLFKYHLSTNNIWHKVDRQGYYFCNRAIGKMKNNVDDAGTYAKYPFCKNCRRYL